MFKNLLNDIKLNKISYLLEVIETGEFKKKVDAYNKLRKKKIDEETGHLIIDKVSSLNNKKENEFNIEISLLSLLFKNYYDSYSTKIFEIFKKLNTDTKYELLNLLCTSNEPSEIILYRELITNYYKDFNNYPICNLALDKDNYELLFPELYVVFKTGIINNNLLLLLNDFVNLGVVPIIHLKNNKASLQKLIINIFKETIKYKIDSKTNFMSDRDYINLRIFAEVAINLEYYISSKETRTYLDKLYKTKDNQLKLFILENYAKKEKNLSKININSIAKDNLSRYPLYSFLSYNNAQVLMPKKYANNKELSLSDLYINYSLKSGYTKVPYDFKLLEERIIGDYKYYIYEFKTPFNYNEEVLDPVTDYLLKNIKIDQELINNAETTYIGISGGYAKEKDPSLIENELNDVKISKYDDDYEKIVSSLLKEEIDKQNSKEISVVKEEPSDVKEVTVVKEESELKKEKFNKIKNIFNKIKNIFSFSRILTFFSILTILSFTVLALYVSNVDLFNIRKNTLKNVNVVSSVKLKNKDLFIETNYIDIFNKEDGEYYVLFFKKKNTSIYYQYINTLLNNNYKFYYVDLSKEENKPIYEGNPTGFVINNDTLLKVKDRVYDFYVIGKPNINDELKSYVDEIKKKEIEEAKEKAKEEKEEKKRIKKEKKERESINVDDILKELEELDKNKEEQVEQPES